MLNLEHDELWFLQSLVERHLAGLSQDEAPGSRIVLAKIEAVLFRHHQQQRAEFASAVAEVLTAWDMAGP